MGLPTSRDETITSAGSIPSALLNKLQDQVVGAKQPSLERWYPLNAQAGSTLAGSGTSSGGFGPTASGSCSFIVGQGIPVGFRITEVEVYAGGSGSITFNLEISHGPSPGSPSTVVAGSLSSLPPSATPGKYTFTLATPYVLLAGDMILPVFAGVASGDLIGPVGLFTDNL